MFVPPGVFCENLKIDYRITKVFRTEEGVRRRTDTALEPRHGLADEHSPGAA
jgi:hypothetical protein